ncbi:hypothetical protein BD779DRAFT_1556630 [Infundibulicybe gibba]|nr:hypothetical protein BD779DRAFT_1556630 [Infundibulicybe gibba]
MLSRQNEITSTGLRAAFTCDGARTSARIHFPTCPSPLPQPKAAIPSPKLRRTPMVKLEDGEMLREEERAYDEWLRAERMIQEKLPVEKKAREKSPQAAQANRTIPRMRQETRATLSAPAPVFLPRLVPHLFPSKKGPRTRSPHTSLFFLPHGSPIARDAVQQEEDMGHDEWSKAISDIKGARNKLNKTVKRWRGERAGEEAEERRVLEERIDEVRLSVKKGLEKMLRREDRIDEKKRLAVARTRGILVDFQQIKL